MAPILALFCDGSWCGDVAGTTSNIKILANCVAGVDVSNSMPHTRDDGTAVVRYFDGVGLTGSFRDYLFNGAVANDIKSKCVEAYKFIVENYKKGSDVWVFGLSRGAHTVRSVAGMINNWGIIDVDKTEHVDSLCDTVYNNYRSRDPEYGPKAGYATRFKERYCQPAIKPSIRFMGLLDTVGALGVPSVDAGIGLSYEFYDQVVSSEVQHVYQALATHDRLSVFTPCFVRRSAELDGYTTVEAWFPGAHYDVGHQRFVFPRNVGVVEGALSRLNDRLNVMGLNIRPTDGYSMLVLKWMMDCMSRHSDDIFRDTLTDRYFRRPRRLLRRELSIDAYDKLSDRFFAILSPFSGILLKDRDIPLYRPAEFIGYDFTGRFKSKSYTNYQNAYFDL
jgi:hypothetical protein